RRDERELAVRLRRRQTTRLAIDLESCGADGLERERRAVDGTDRRRGARHHERAARRGRKGERRSSLVHWMLPFLRRGTSCVPLEFTAVADNLRCQKKD